ncbi:MAG: hypothetical protein KatS3mg091_705 [Patescibacteria group bacterium]|nr:MAG: hypothetical protein KatS3mg091_705 [Patescibacteria group bacterium]
MKRLLVSFALFVFVLFAFVVLATAQEEVAQNTQTGNNQPRAIGYGSICLRPVEFAENSCPDNRPAGVNCTMPAPDSNTFPSGNIDHAVRIRNTPESKFPLDQDIYIVGCVFENDSYVCSPGLSDKSKNADNIKAELARLGFIIRSGQTDNLDTHQFELQKGKTNPIITKDGNIDLIVRSYTADGSGHAFFGIYEKKPNNIGDGSNRTPQLEQINFKQAAVDCADIFWDPEGYVFDAKTLMPIPNIDVYIYSVKGSQIIPVASRPGFDNPFKTVWDGSFFFYVEPDIYTLDIQSDSYEFPVDITQVNPQFRNSDHGYKCDVPGYDLYTDRLQLDETKGKMIRCDIPLLSKNSGQTQTVRSYMIFNQALAAEETKTKVSANVWPLNASFSVIQENEFGYQTVLATARAEKGGFTVIINNSLINPELPLYIVLSSTVNKTSVTETNQTADKQDNQQNNGSEQGSDNTQFTPGSPLLNWIKNLVSKAFSLNVSAQTNDSFDRFSARPMYPVLQYLEGVAYDDSNNPIPNAVIKIIDKASNQEILRVQADENGFFKIPPAYLPMFEYYLNIEASDGRTFAYTTTEFVNMNKDYLNTVKLDLVRARRNGVQIPEYEGDSGQVTITANNNQMQANETPAAYDNKKTQETPIDKEKDKDSEETNLNQSLLIGVILLLFILSVVGLVMILYIYKLRKLEE